MHVGVHGNLAAHRAAVPADVVPVGMVLLVHPRLDVPEEHERGVDFRRRQIEDGLRVPDRDDDARAPQRALLLLVLQKDDRLHQCLSDSTLASLHTDTPWRFFQ